MSAPQLYLVHFWLDDRLQTPGRCWTDHPYQRGDLIYAGAGRAVVRSCAAVTPVAELRTGLVGQQRRRIHRVR